tara:strand:+ start:5023 stop:5343 length:321 start_codon:yes stop_codon:yes gene_type:complete
MELEHKMMAGFDIRLEGTYEGKRGNVYLAKVKNKRKYKLIFIPHPYHFWNVEDNYETLYVSTKSYEDTLSDILHALIQHATFYAPKQNQFTKVIFEWETLRSKHIN